MSRSGARLAAIAALTLAAAVGAGAFGAHALRDRLEARELTLWETGARYLAYAGLAGLAMAARTTASRAAAVGTMGVLAGGALFAATLFGLALGGPRWFGAVTPMGGLLMIAGLVTFATGLWRTRAG